jgi:hypothetical protein
MSITSTQHKRFEIQTAPKIYGRHNVLKRWYKKWNCLRIQTVKGYGHNKVLKRVYDLEKCDCFEIQTAVKGCGHNGVLKRTYETLNGSDVLSDVLLLKDKWRVGCWNLSGWRQL